MGVLIPQKFPVALWNDHTLAQTQSVGVPDCGQGSRHHHGWLVRAIQQHHWLCTSRHLVLRPVIEVVAWAVGW